MPYLRSLVLSRDCMRSPGRALSCVAPAAVARACVRTVADNIGVWQVVTGATLTWHAPVLMVQAPPWVITP